MPHHVAARSTSPEESVLRRHRYSQALRWAERELRCSKEKKEGIVASKYRMYGKEGEEKPLKRRCRLSDDVNSGLSNFAVSGWVIERGVLAMRRVKR